MTRENLISIDWHQKSPTYGHVTKFYLESKFQHKRMKTTSVLSKLLRFSQQQQIQVIKLLKNYKEKDKANFGQYCHR